MRRAVLRVLLLVVLSMVVVAIAGAAPDGQKVGHSPVRFATFNASLNRFNAGDLV